MRIGINFLAKSLKSTTKDIGKRLSTDILPNPYLTEEQDSRFANYRALIIRTIDQNSELTGPATVVFPGIPITLYNRSPFAVVSIMSLKECNRAFIHDADTKIYDNKPIDWNLYPCLTIPALLHLYKKAKTLVTKEDLTFRYNETFLPSKQDTVTCLTSFYGNLDNLFEIQKHNNLSTEIDDMLFYNRDLGKFYYLNIKDSGNDQMTTQNIKQYLDRGKISRGDELVLPTNLLTSDHFDSNIEMQKFAKDCYQESVSEVANHLILNKNKLLPFGDPLNSNLLKILLKDAQGLILQEGEKKLLDNAPKTSFQAKSAKKNRSDIDQLLV